MSGYLLTHYIDEDHCDPARQVMWLIIGITTISSPILITLFDRCLREPLHKGQGKATEETTGENEIEEEGEFLN